MLPQTPEDDALALCSRRQPVSKGTQIGRRGRIVRAHGILPPRTIPRDSISSRSPLASARLSRPSASGAYLRSARNRRNLASRPGCGGCALRWCSGSLRSDHRLLQHESHERSGDCPHVATHVENGLGGEDATTVLPFDGLRLALPTVVDPLALYGGRGYRPRG